MFQCSAHRKILPDQIAFISKNNLKVILSTYANSTSSNVCVFFASFALAASFLFRVGILEFGSVPTRYSVTQATVQWRHAKKGSGSFGN